MQLKLLPVIHYCWRHLTTGTVASCCYHGCYVNIAGDGGKICAAFGCNNYQNDGKELPFFRFPRNWDR